jgi:hypothetical protein
VITNYDPRALTDAARAELNAKARNNPANFVLIDIRSEHPGGDWPLFGALKLRSFNSILDFVAGGGVGAQEYDVARDPRTGEGDDNPARALGIGSLDTATARDNHDAPGVVRHHVDQPIDQHAVAHMIDEELKFDAFTQP